MGKTLTSSGTKKDGFETAKENWKDAGDRVTVVVKALKDNPEYVQEPLTTKL